MANPRQQKQVGLFSKSLHWLLALLMIGLLALGWVMVQLDYFNPYYDSAPALHYSLGILVFFLVFIKIIWQLAKPLPEHDDRLKKYELYASKIVHFILLLFMIMMPISGYLVITAGTNDASFFGLFDLPTLFKISKPVRDAATFFHTYFPFILVGFIVVHILAALKHKLIDKMQTARDMWPK
ncbi:MAG: cytochrome b [Alphaproteobacteria bacterium]|nr:cytochrome b [Alphaproteobacteria bacterium]